MHGDLQGAMVRELFKLAEKSQREQTKPAGHGRLQQWYFFMVAAFWMYFRWDISPWQDIQVPA